MRMFDTSDLVILGVLAVGVFAYFSRKPKASTAVLTKAMTSTKLTQATK